MNRAKDKPILTKKIPERDRPLGDILHERGILDTETLKKALSLQEKSNTGLGQILVKKGFVSEEDLLYTLSAQYKLEYLKKLEVKDIQALKARIPLKFVHKYRIVPFRLEGNSVKVALTDPEQLHPLDELRMLWLGYELIVVLASESEILRITHKYYDTSNEGEDQESNEGFEFLEDIEDLQNSMDLANEAPIIKMVNMVLTNAVSERSSDIHIEPQEKELWVRYRVDGMLHKVLTPPKAIQNGMISRIKIMANMNIAENRLPQDGRIKIRFSGKDIDIRVSSLPSQFGERIVMRILNKTDVKHEIETIGMENSIQEKYVKMLKNPNGIILITGPTGSGKTSTLYASLNILNEEVRNIITVEDPVEYQIEGISQIQAKSDIGLTFAEGLRSILRQDPDVIMIGEIRDEETVRVAIQASLTGHLVFSTLHTNDAPSAVIRLLDMGIEPYLITSTCLGFMAQRLVRVLCPSCKVKESISLAQLQKLGYNPTRKPVKKTYFIYKPKGCRDCMDIGYRGRTGIYELLVMDNDLRNFILKNPNLDDFRKMARQKDMSTLRESALQKVIDGVSSVEEVLRVT